MAFGSESVNMKYICLTIIAFIVILEQSPVSGGLFRFAARPRDDEMMDDFSCPGIGNYAVPGHCDRYFHCPAADERPSAIKICPQPKMFNRLSRNCHKKRDVDCKFCEKRGYKADITSKTHFIICSKGQIGHRYKCRQGEYDSKAKKCDAVKGAMNLDVDARVDSPKHIKSFQKKWRNAENVENNDSGLHEKEKEKGNSNSVESREKRKISPEN